MNFEPSSLPCRVIRTYKESNTQCKILYHSTDYTSGIRIFNDFSNNSTVEPPNKGRIETRLRGLEVTVFYSRYGKTSIWDHEKCPLNGGIFCCVLYKECPLLEVPLC